MHDPAYLRRPRAKLGLATSVAAIFAAGVVTAIALRPAKPPVIHVAAPAQPTVVPFAVPSVVMIPAPPPPAPPLPPPPPEPEPPITPGPRALAPIINVACTTGGADATCDWDDGFPAISTDGTLIAISYVPDDGGRGYPGLSIQLLDARTAKVVKSYVVLSPDEYLEPEDAAWPKLRAKIARRAATAQRVLDAKQFRALTTIDLVDVGVESEGEDMFATDSTLRAERAGDAIRVIDRAANSVVWQHRYPVEAAFPRAKNPSVDGEGCYPSNTRGIGLSWDATTRTLLTRVLYASGPCYCGDELLNYVVRL